MSWFQPLLGFDPITWFQSSNLVEPSHGFNSHFGFTISSSSILILHFCFVPHYLVFTITPGLIFFGEVLDCWTPEGPQEDSNEEALPGPSDK